MVAVKSRLRRSLFVTHRDVSALIEALYLSNAQGSQTLLLRLVDLLHHMEGTEGSFPQTVRASTVQQGKCAEYARLSETDRFGHRQSELESQMLCTVCPQERR